MDYKEMLAHARELMQGRCSVCRECNGVACSNRIPGPGAKGSGDVAKRNFDAWRDIRVNMDTLCDGFTPDTSVTLFDRTFVLPVFAGPVGAVDMHYGDAFNDRTYNDQLVRGCVEAGTCAFTGDGMDPSVMEAATRAVAGADGLGIPTIKPWNDEIVADKMELVRASGAFAVAMDVDAAGLPFLKNLDPPAGNMSVERLRAIIASAERPFIVKGVMTVTGALKAMQAGASAIVVSNHGGRVLDQCPATAEVLPEIVDAVGGGIRILVDGGIRSGVDVFKALALGADGVIVARPYAIATYGGGAEGVKMLTDKLRGELEDTMSMCGAPTIADITRDMVR
jgi:4-hydroxymandelate oxidase